MSVTREAVRDLIDTRVSIRFAGGSMTATLRALTPSDELIMSVPKGHELRVPYADLESIEDARFTCAECGRRSNTQYGDDHKCADCYRFWCSRQPAARETCPDCGVEGAVYSPAYKVWRCTQCHAKAGSFTGSTVEANVLTAAVCRTADVDSPLHDWKKVKAQWLCRQCEVKHFGKKPAYAEG